MLKLVLTNDSNSLEAGLSLLALLVSGVAEFVRKTIELF